MKFVMAGGGVRLVKAVKHLGGQPAVLLDGCLYVVGIGDDGLDTLLAETAIQMLSRSCAEKNKR